MVTRHIDIDNNKWVILLIFDFDVDYDEIELSAIMDSFGMKSRAIDRALSILSTYNSGMCVSNEGVRMSAIFIGKPTSAEQFWDSIAHESLHVCQAILSYYGEDDWMGETPAYLDGYIFRKIVGTIGVPCR